MGTAVSEKKVAGVSPDGAKNKMMKNQKGKRNNAIATASARLGGDAKAPRNAGSKSKSASTSSKSGGGRIGLTDAGLASSVILALFAGAGAAVFRNWRPFNKNHKKNNDEHEQSQSKSEEEAETLRSLKVQLREVMATLAAQKRATEEAQADNRRMAEEIALLLLKEENANNANVNNAGTPQGVLSLQGSPASSSSESWCEVTLVEERHLGEKEEAQEGEAQEAEEGVYTLRKPASEEVEAEEAEEEEKEEATRAEPTAPSAPSTSSAKSPSWRNPRRARCVWTSARTRRSRVGTRRATRARTSS
jgi:hypothetical protein